MSAAKAQISARGRYCHPNRIPVCRRAERGATELAGVESVNPAAVKYLNRLSDWLFVAGRMAKVMAYDPEPKVSIDFTHTEESSIFAPDQTKVTGKRLVRVLAWYDNEWGFSARMADVAAAMGRLV